MTMVKETPVSGAHGLTKMVPTESKTKVSNLPLYHIYKDGNGQEFKVANMNNPIICPRKGVIEIECIRKTNSLEPRFSLSNAYDRELDLWFGVPMGIDTRTKEIRWQRFQIGDFKTYNLNKFSDAAEWAVISRAPWLIGSPYQKGKPYFKKHDREADANEIIIKSTIRSKAMEIAGTIKIEEMCDMYRNFGRNPEGFSPNMLKAELIKIAERSPKEFVSLWDNANRSVITIFKRSEALGLITFDINKGGYMWKDSLSMGMTEESAIKFLTENKSIMANADLESKSRDGATKSYKTLSKAEQDFFGEDAKDEDVELIDLRKAAKIMGLKDFMTKSKDELQKIVDELSEN